MFKQVPSSVRFPELEQRVIEFWRERDIFKRSLAKDAPRGRWVFYEGPPTANGKPGVHHVISRAFKDLFPRFKTMQGYRVGRKGGWDTHGLPVEIAIEKRLGFSNKQQIEDYGIERFNRLCRDYVFENIRDWNEMTERIGFWLDLDDAYVTYDNGYIESCWWVMKQLWERGLLEEDYKTTWHSPSSNTTLASHEVSLGYQEDYEDPSVFPMFPTDQDPLVERGLMPARDERPLFFVAWTTTPWTLAANVALAVKPDATYLLVEARRAPTGGAAVQDDPEGDPSELYIVAEAKADEVFGEGQYRSKATFSGRELEGLRYEPIMTGQVPEGQDLERGFRVVADDFVELDEGTGIVHIAPAYGDLDIGRTHGLPLITSVDLTGKMLPEVGIRSRGERGRYAGLWFKGDGGADERITRDLHEAGLMYKSGTIRHTYPLNWRDGTPLMNVAKKSWYIKTTKLKDQLLANNDKINWVPDHIRTGRFGRWLENNVDWALSRERYWGAPLPIWQSEDGEERICVGSLAELQALAGRDLSELELHRPFVDEVEFERNGKRFRRVPHTVDVWFESGAMPYAQWHHTGDPESRERIAENFPADYICEAIDQTRGWFYSLHALATLLTDTGDAAAGRPPGPLAALAPDSPAFRNVIVLGHIVDENGEKMSKSKGNTVDPEEVVNTLGADALRWYLYASSPPEATKRFSLGLVEETLRDFFMTLWNSYAFFVLYANLDGPDLRTPLPAAERPAIDRWLLARLHALVRDTTALLEAYDPTGAARALRDFVVDDLSNWYVRRNRRRFWKNAGTDDSDKRSAYLSLYEALTTVARLMAPLAPFVSEEIYRNLVCAVDPEAPESVHLASWPEADAALVDEALLRDMQALVRVVELGRAARAASGHKTRQPLPEVLVRVRSAEELAGLRHLEAQLLEELNVKSVRYLDVTDDFVDYDVKPNLPLLGPRLGRRIPELRRALAERDGREIAANVRDGRDTVVTLGGEELRLEPEAFLLDARSPEGYAAVEERGYLAALNTRLTPELVREGLARDAVRLIQNARKNAGLEVADRIRLGLEPGGADGNGNGELRAALAEHRDELALEVLAEELRLEAVAEPQHVEDAEVEGEPLRITLRRA